MKITVNEVRKVMNERGLKICTVSMYRPLYDACCPLGAMYINDKGVTNDIEAMWTYVKEKYGERFVCGFWNGFDNNGLDETLEVEEFINGYKNGEFIREQLGEEVKESFY